MSLTNTESTPHNLFSVPDISPEVNRRELQYMQRAPSSRVFVHAHHSPYEANELMNIANEVVSTKGKGIYASDEGPDAMDALLEDKNQTKSLTDDQKRQRRKAWKESALSALNSDYISGVTLSSEDLLDFKSGPSLSTKGIIPGIRANGELAPIPRSTEEFIVQGLDNLLPRLQLARTAGARFSTWRVPIACTSTTIPVPLPTHLALEIAAESCAQFAVVSQQAGLVPIVEPDVDFSEDADLARSAEVHERITNLIYWRMKAHGVLLEGSLIRPTFPQAGLKHSSRAGTGSEDIAIAAASVISRSVPTAVPGVLFSSGTLSPETATKYTAALNALVLASPLPSAFSRLPRLTFAFGPVIQNDAVEDWKAGDEDKMRGSFEKWSKACWQASKGVVL